MSAAISDWVIWQLADSAFPSGGFAHSAGLEAAWQLGEVDSAARLADFLRASLLAAARGAVPFALAACDGAEFGGMDRGCDVFLCNQVANRASRAQGLGFLAAACRSLGGAAILELGARVRAEGWAGHWAPVFGAVCGGLGIGRERVARLMLFVTLRGLVSAAVRLGVVGTIKAQAVQFELGAYGEELAARAMGWGVEDAAQVSPVIEVVQGLHDRLYSRLFLS